MVVYLTIPVSFLHKSGLEELSLLEDGPSLSFTAVKVFNYSLRGNERNQLNAMNEVGITDQIVIMIEAELLII